MGVRVVTRDAERLRRSTTSAHTESHRLPRSRAVVALLALVLCACDSGGGSSHEPVHARYEVWIDAVDPDTTAASVQLFGAATCDACPPSEAQFGSCPPIQGPFASSIAIQWANLTTGASGSAMHGIYGSQSWLFSYCTTSYSHRWSAWIPLAYGANEIQLAATGSAWLPGTDTVSVMRTPPAPQNVKTESSHSQIVVTWTAVNGADSYELLWSTNPNLSLPATHVVPNATSPFVDDGLSDDVARYYAVRAIAQGVAGPLSEVVLGTAGWTSTTLPIPALAGWLDDASIAVDSNGAAHVHVSRDDPSSFARIVNDYATNAGGSWGALEVAEVGAIAADIAVDANDEVHVAYLDITSGKYARLVGGSWVEENFASPADCYVGLRLDPLGNARVLFQRHQFQPTQLGRIEFASNASGAWTSELVDTAHFGCFQDGAKLELELDPWLGAHALYLGAAPTLGLRYATNASGTWTSEEAASGYVRGLSLALDHFGTPHVVWTDENNALHYAWRQAQSVWPDEVVDTFAFGPSIAVDAQANAHLSYVEYANDELRYAKRTSGTWSLVPIGPAVDADTSIALDAQGKAHIAFFSAGRVMYATNR